MQRANPFGFTLIEVLVSLLVISIGALGMLTLQGQALRYTREASLRGSAVMLADDLLEMMRSNREALLDASASSDLAGYVKAAGGVFPEVGGVSCARRDRSGGGPAVAAADLYCWRQKVSRLLPVTPAILTEAFEVCRSRVADRCASDNSGAAVMIRLAWADSPGGLCADGICRYALRAEL
ncbi:type IV pilus modification protein PilV [Pseudomonas panipatensis]|uniref:Type IV pilus assembly protein PilV n=1 Tax=Pseudomonas panipatensis TaxID=428992 RepID=A0A1G8H9D5_9PSED|nr:type IV pilus modification protein PilV [Pseudomonas panipatensis]SDI03199.1 type IV pilus assembly protein PilV [Pseudomonas panipatensis]SMP57261.1 type IV pilus assembly protein PilV [Pseudomonas panipatensis]